MKRLFNLGTRPDTNRPAQLQRLVRDLEIKVLDTKLSYEPRREKTGLRGFRPGPT